MQCCLHGTYVCDNCGIGMGFGGDFLDYARCKIENGWKYLKGALNDKTGSKY